MTTRGRFFLFAFILLAVCVAALRAQQQPAPPPAAPASPRPAVAPSAASAVVTPRAPQAPPAPAQAAVRPATAAPAAPPAPPQEMTIFAGSGNFLGVQTEDITRENMARYNVGAPRGVGVVRVIKESPAERAGLRENDVIVRFDGDPITSVRKLNRLIGEAAPEHTARLVISRGGVEQEIAVTLGKRPGGFALDESLLPNVDALRRQGEAARRGADEARRWAEEWRRNNQGMLSFGRGARRRIGIMTNPLTEQLAAYFGVERGGGVLVTAVTENSPAARAGIRAGDVITEVDGERIAQAGDLARVLNRRNEGEVTLNLIRDKKARTVKLAPERVQAPTFEFAPELFATSPIARILPRRQRQPPPAPQVNTPVRPKVKAVVL